MLASVILILGVWLWKKKESVMNAAERAHHVWVGASSILEASGPDALDFLHRLSTQAPAGRAVHRWGIYHDCFYNRARN